MTIEFSKEAKSAIAVMRSLIISEKGTSSLFRILGDFRKEEGHPLMYKDFGYRSAADFLQASGEFIIREQNGEVVIFVKPSEGSSHIAKMIAAQKSTKPRAAAKKPAFATTWNRTPYQTNRYPGACSKFQGYQQQPKQQFSSYQQRYPAQQKLANFSSQQPKQQLSSYEQRHTLFTAPQQPAKPFGSYQGSCQQQAQPSNSFYQPQQQQSKGSCQQQAQPSNSFYQPQQQQSKPVSSYQQQQRNNANNPLSSFFGGGTKSTTDYRNQSAAPPQPTPTPKVEPPTATPAGPSNSTNPFLQAPATNPFVKPDQPTAKPRTPAATAPIKMDSSPPTSSNPAPQDAPSQTPSVEMDTSEDYAMPPVRKVRQSFKAPVAESMFTPETIARAVRVQQQSLMEQEVFPSCSHNPPTRPSPAPFQWDQPGVAPDDLLFKYGQFYDSLPVYKFFEVKKRFHCKVTINGTVYRTYPDDYATELECKSAVARIAIDAIRRNETRQYRECEGTDAEIASQIYDLLLPCQYGMQMENIPKAFRDSYGSLLPRHWKLIVQANLTRLFKTEAIPNNCVIVFAVLSEEDSPPSEQAQRMATNLIELPWSEQYWDLYVTYPVSPAEIWARLVGPMYSDRMADMLTCVEEMMARGEGEKATNVTAGEYYLVHRIDCWHRVRVERVERAASVCQCYFIDIGGTDSVALDQIYVCEPRFLELPGQTVCFALRGLQKFNDDPSVEAYLQDSVGGRVLVGEVHTTQEMYIHNGPIQITLFDTSTEETVNLNDVLKTVRNESPDR